MNPTNLMRQNANIYNKTGYDKFAHAAFGSPTQVRCRFENSTKMRLLPNQQMIQLAGIFYFPPNTTISVEDKISYGALNYTAFTVNSEVDGEGEIQFIKVEVQRWQT